MSIIGPLPNTIANGQLGDASKVQQNFDWIVSQVNANASPTGGGTNMTAFGTTPATAINGVGVITIFLTKFNDTLNEFNAGTGMYTPASTGIYRFWGWGQIASTVSTTTISGINQSFELYVNGTDIQQFGVVQWPFADSTAHTVTVPCSGTLSLTAGDVVTFRILGTFAGSGLTGTVSNLQIQRMA